jgi:hypothetical protein
LTGDQILQLALARQSNTQAMTDIVNLGGNSKVAVTAGDVYIANVVLTLPHSTPSGLGKSHPFPTDLLTQQVQITVELNTPASIFAGTAGNITTANPTLTLGQFRFSSVC